MLQFISKIVRLILPEKRIWEIKNNHHIPSMEWTLSNLQKLGFNPAFAIDAGACDGDWTRMFKKIFPLANVLMIEAQVEKETLLKDVVNSVPRTSIHIALLGAESGKDVVFNISDTVSSVLEEYKENEFKKENRQTETLDSVVLSTQNGTPPPSFIKLDVQGYELEVLKGAPVTLESVEFILCEVSLLEINKGCPLIAEVLQFMEAHEFVAYDICSFIRRPLDKALWQTDILFIRRTHPFIRNKHWN